MKVRDENEFASLDRLEAHSSKAHRAYFKYIKTYKLNNNGKTIIFRY